MDTFIKLIIAWGPMVLLVGAWVYFMRRSGCTQQGRYFEQVHVYMTEHIAETRRLNENLERIAMALEARTARENGDDA